MKIAVFTGNQPRHLALARELANIADEVLVVQESGPTVRGPSSPAFDAYFAGVDAAEREVFGPIGFLPANVRPLAIGRGDLNRLPLEVLAPALDADVTIVFGASYIKTPLVDHLIERRAINLHMGVSPYFRGAACNFWALHNGRPELVGATVHYLSRGLDSGGMLFHALPRSGRIDPTLFGMLAVRAAQRALAAAIADGSLMRLEAVAQDRSREIRYSRSADFTAETAAAWLAAPLTAADVEAATSAADPSLYLRPVWL